MRNKKIVLSIAIALSIITLAACTKDSNGDQNSVGETKQNQQVENSEDKVDHTDKTDSINNTKENKNIQEDDATNMETKIKGRRKEFLERLDNIQKELDALPEKKDSDAGITNAMRNYYGRSYEMYDKELNEIYTLLKKELSPETMKDLKTKQMKWIEQKEDIANKEASQFKGGTFEFVALYISLYESTKERCYELVNEYMTD